MNGHTDDDTRTRSLSDGHTNDASRSRSLSDACSPTYRRKDNNILNGILRDKFFRKREPSQNDDKNTILNIPAYTSQQPIIVIESPEEKLVSPVVWWDKNGRLGVSRNKRCSGTSTGYHSGGSEISMNHNHDAEHQV